MTDRVFAVAMMKDEADIAPTTVRWMASQVDGVIVADNGSTDGTGDLLRGIPGVTVVDDPDPAYYQSRKVSALAAAAARQGAAWVIPFDADEWWHSAHGRLADVLRAQPPEVAVVRAELYDHVATGADPDAPPVERIGWRRVTPGGLAKVACRTGLPVVIEQGNHGAHYPTPGPPVEGLLEVRHFPYRSVEQMIRKARNGAAAYAMTDLPEETGQHWRDYGRLSDEQIADVFRMYFWAADPAADPGLIYDPAVTE